MSDRDARYFTNLKARAKRKKIPFDLSLDYLKTLPCSQCPITYAKIQYPWISKRQTKYSKDHAALDKIVPELGYVKGNVYWLSTYGNFLKSNHTLITLKRVIKYIKAHT